MTRLSGSASNILESICQRAEMPIFEYACDTYKKPFEEFGSGNNSDDILCPTCGGEQIRKKLSTFCAGQRQKKIERRRVRQVFFYSPCMFCVSAVKINYNISQSSFVATKE